MGTGGNTRHLKTTLKKYLLLLPFFVFNFSTFATEVPPRPSCDQWLDPQYLHQLNDETQAWVMAQTDRAMKTWVNTDQGLQIRKQLDLNNHAGNQVDIFVDDGFNYEFRVSKSKPRGVLARNSIKLGGEWEIILDLQQLSELEGIPWSFQAAECFNDRCLVTLSKAGKDSNVVREFDLKTKTFVQDGFFLDEGLNQVFWAYEDSIYVVSENKPSRLTSTGHPKHLRLLNRNQKLEEGRILRSLKPDEKFHMVDYFTNGYDDVMVDTAHRSFNESTVYLRFGRGKWHRLPLLARLQVQGFLGNYIIFKLEKTHIRKNSY